MVGEESQPLFSSHESSAVPSTPVPLEQQEPSSFGPMHSTRHQPAPMPELLKALHRIVTAPAPVLSGRAGRDAVVSVVALSPLDHGNVDPGSVTSIF